MANCDICGKSFDSDDALSQHNTAKHGAEKKEKKPIKINGKYAALGIVFVLVIIAAFILFASKPSYVAGPKVDHIKGTGSAEIIEFSDFQCPACGAAYPQVKEFLKTNSDKVKFIYKHFPLPSHPYAPKAAEASEFASDQGKFWEYHDKLFDNQRNLLRSDLTKYAEQIGLDKEKFNACLDSGVMADRVNADFAEGNKLKVDATPTFFINGRKIAGVLSVQQFEQEITR